MGGVVDAIFGGGKKTKVEYQYPPEASAIIYALQRYASQLESLIPQVEPQLKQIYQNLLNQIQTWMQAYPEQLRGLKETRDIWEATDIAKERVREDISKVKEDVLRNLYRDLGMKGLISTSAGTQAITEKMKEIELDPLLDIEKTGFAQELGKRMGVLSDYMSYLRSLPELYESIAQLGERQTLMPWTLRERIMGSLTGVGQLAGQLATPVVRQPQPGLFQQLLPLAMPFASAFAFAKWIK